MIFCSQFQTTKSSIFERIDLRKKMQKIYMISVNLEFSCLEEVYFSILDEEWVKEVISQHGIRNHRNHLKRIAGNGII